MKNSFNILNSLAKFETASDRLIFFCQKCAFSSFCGWSWVFFERGNFWCKPWLDTLLKCELVREAGIDGIDSIIWIENPHQWWLRLFSCHAIDYWPHLSVLLRPQYLSSYRSRKRGSTKLFVKTPPRNYLFHRSLPANKARILCLQSFRF